MSGLIVTVAEDASGELVGRAEFRRLLRNAEIARHTGLPPEQVAAILPRHRKTLGDALLKARSLRSKVRKGELARRNRRKAPLVRGVKAR